MGRRRGGRQCFSSYLIRCQILVEIRILVKLDKMLRLDCCVPEKYRKSRISNIAHLECSYCGQVSGEITHLLSWPKDLQTLRISIGIPMGSNRYAFDSPKCTECNMAFQALSSRSLRRWNRPYWPRHACRTSPRKGF